MFIRIWGYPCTNVSNEIGLFSVYLWKNIGFADACQNIPCFKSKWLIQQRYTYPMVSLNGCLHKSSFISYMVKYFVSSLRLFLSTLENIHISTRRTRVIVKWIASDIYSVNLKGFLVEQVPHWTLKNSEICIGIFSFNKLHLKMSFAKYWSC